MGLYTDDLTRLGLFAADAWRAGRLVVDTGLHAMGWTRAQAISGSAGPAPTPQIEIESEVDRYISYPGQALAYMVVPRGTLRLRQAATHWLGPAFDLREFHDVILRAGLLPLPALAATVERWTERARLELRADAEPVASHPSAGPRPGAAARALRTTPKRQTAVTCMAVHHRQMALNRKSST